MCNCELVFFFPQITKDVAADSQIVFATTTVAIVAVQGGLSVLAAPTI